MRDHMYRTAVKVMADNLGRRLDWVEGESWLMERAEATWDLVLERGLLILPENPDELRRFLDSLVTKELP